MSMKSIFQQGIQERRRRKSLGRKGRELREKERALEGLVIALGRKAWESGEDISRFKELQNPLQESQKNLDELSARERELQQQREKLEDKRKRENERMDTARKGVEGKKQDLDKRIRAQNSQLEADRKETRQARARLAAIAVERSQMKSKAAEASISDAEKADAVRKLDLLDQEERALQAGINAREEAGKPVEILVASLQEESDQMQKNLDELRSRQKEILDGLDQRIVAVKDDLSENNTGIREIKEKRDSQYHALGDKLADSGDSYPKLDTEKSALDLVRGEIKTIQSEIAGLENQQDENQVSAYKKMMWIVIGGIVLLAALIAVLVFLFNQS